MFFLMTVLPPSDTRTSTLCPSPTLYRSAVVDIEQGALLAFVQHLLALLAQVVEDAGHVGLHRFDVFAERERLVERLLVVDRVGVEIFGDRKSTRLKSRN